jgi:2-keto-4-pentenoate hydratase/2-oxohepta-3-ene-1,7-dioic acid hydratase in catechol pathway
LRLVNFRAEGRASCGALTSRGILDLGARLGERGGDVLSLLRAGLLGPARHLAGMGGHDYAPEEAQLLNPAGRNTRYFCIGVNYPERNEEYRDGSEKPKYPSIFMRTHTSFAAPGTSILRPQESEQLDYEGEIALVIGKGGRRIPEEAALSHVLGYSCANEGSVRDWLRHSKFNVTQGKNFDRSGSIGPAVVTVDEVGTAPLRVTTRVNGEVRQDDTSDRMIFPMACLISYLSRFCTLETGDVILTGTPSGAGARLVPPRYLVPGDVVEVEVSRVGVLRNEVADEHA